MSSNWYEIKNIDQLDSPALVVFPERIKTNIDRMIQMAGGTERLMPHIKTHKMGEVIQLQMDKGITKFKCATIAEGELLGEAGAKEVLLAYQPVGPKVERLLKLVQKYPMTQFSALIDDPAAAQGIAQVFAKANKTVPVYLDLDVGMHRTGIAAGDKAFELYRLAKVLEGIEPVGLHLYDGHFREPSFAERKADCDKAFLPVRQLARRIEEKTTIIAGGTPTFPIHALRSDVRCSPGTCLLWDWGYNSGLPEQDFLFAALVVSRVISKTDDRYICTDLGHKSIAAEKPFPRVYFLNLPNAKAVLQSEEHLVLDVGNNQAFSVGTVLYGVPNHICPTCALYERAYVVEDQQVAKEWKVVSRDRKITV